MDVTDVQAMGARVRDEIARGLVGQHDAVELMLIALFSKGHVLLEGPPGTAKTFLAQCFAACLDLDFGRIQFTPDLMPGDVIGTNLFNFQTNTFSLTRGPIFTDLLLADEDGFEVRARAHSFVYVLVCNLGNSWRMTSHR